MTAAVPPASSTVAALRDRVVPWIAMVLVAGICVVGVASVERIDAENDRQAARLMTLSHLTSIRARLEGSLNAILVLGQSLSSVIAADPSLTDEDIGHIARELLARQSLIRRISVAHNFVITQVVPRESNEAEIGKNLLDRLDLREAALRAVGSREEVLAGPIPPLNGGRQVLVGRAPVFLTPPGGKAGSGTLWGIINLVVDSASLFEDAGLNNPALPIQIAIRGTDGLGPFGSVFYGDARLFDGDGVRLDVTLAGGRWQMVALPKPELAAIPSGRQGFRLLGALVALLSGALTYAIARYVIEQRQGRERLNTILTAAPFPISITRTSDSVILYANDRACQYLGTEPATLTGRSMFEFYARPEERHTLVAAVLADGFVRGNEVLIRSTTGREFWALAAATLMTYDSQPAIFVAFSDLTAVKTQQQRIEELAGHERALAEVLHLALQSISVDEFLQQSLDSVCRSVAWAQGARCTAVVLEENDGNERMVRQVAARSFAGDEADAGDGAAPTENQGDGEARVTRCGDVACGRPWCTGRLEFPILSGDALLGALAVCMSPEQTLTEPVRDFFNRVADVLSIGIAHRRAEQEIANLAFRDPLTNLPNRRMLFSRLQHELSMASRLNLFGAVLYLDLDRFKYLNDALGHSFGDALLIQVARRLSENLRDSDTVARVGGDEFVVLLPGLSASLSAAATGAYNTADKIRRALCAPYDLNGHVHHLTPSLGIALFPHDAQDVEALLRHADTAMYHSKAEGRNTIRFFEPGMQASAESRIQLENELRQALQRGEFSLVYQPLMAQDRTFVGAEALLRWSHPVRGNVPPAEFIPVAEETGLIIEIGRWVLEAVAHQLTIWDGEGLIDKAHHIAINISPRQFHQHDFTLMVREILARSGIEPSRLVLEITEGVLIKDPANVVAKMEELHRLGIRFYIDDFGTGYSSMSYLKRLPVHGLKIDQSFVQDLVGDSTDAAIIEAIIGMARRFNLSVVAEGVETESQLSFLRVQGCTVYQGFHFSRPMPPDSFAHSFLRDGTAGRKSEAPSASEDA